jgi:P-type Ca2+ transporter type 2C
MDWTALAAFVLVVMVTQMELFNRLLGTVPPTAGRFGLALAAALLLLARWEIGRLIARRRTANAGLGASHRSGASPGLVAGS